MPVNQPDVKMAVLCWNCFAKLPKPKPVTGAHQKNGLCSKCAGKK